MTLALAVLLAFTVPLQDTTEQPDPQITLDDFRVLLGSWAGDESGAAGTGVGTRTYSLKLKDKFIYLKNTSVFEPQEKNPEGEVHEDWAMINFDSGRGAVVMRQFFGEGYVITYVLDPASEKGKKYVFLSEAMDNTPPGMRARLTLEFDENGSFSENFELAMPGKDLAPFIYNVWTRDEK